MAELFTLVDVGDMHLHGRSRHRLERIVKGNTGMSVGSGIQDDAVHVKATAMDAIDEIALMVALEIVEMHIGKRCTQLVKIVFEGTGTVDAWLSTTQEIQVRTIDDLNFLHEGSLIGYG